MSKSKERHSRLGWVELHILLALGDADLHGYAIMQKVSHDTSGRIRLGAGTLYGAIKRLTAARLIAVAPQRETTDQRLPLCAVIPREELLGRRPGSGSTLVVDRSFSAEAQRQ